MTATCSQTVQLQPQQPSASGVRLELPNGNRVFITPLHSELDRPRSIPTATGNTVATQPSKIISKILLRALSGTVKTKFKTFTLRHVDITQTNSCKKLKNLIREQLQDDLVSCDFVSYKDRQQSI